MKIELTAKEAAGVLRRRQSSGRQKINGPKLAAPRKAPPVDDGSGYMAWLHYDIPCIACVVLGRGASQHNPIEAAHQKLQLAGRNWHRRAGRRGPHWTCAPLCADHHRLGPLRCDPAQGKFWGIVGLEIEQVIDFVEALNAAFRGGELGAPIVRRFADLASRQRLAA